jgi:hypothetical protein
MLLGRHLIYDLENKNWVVQLKPHYLGIPKRKQTMKALPPRKEGERKRKGRRKSEKWYFKQLVCPFDFVIKDLIN